MKTILLIYTTLLFILTTESAHAYKVGDRVDQEAIDALQLTEGIAVVDIFASWCASCKIELPLINQLNHTFSALKSSPTDNNHHKTHATIVGIDMDESLSDAIQFQKELKLDFFIYNDNKQTLVSKFNPIGVPAIYYIKDGVVKKVIYGAVEHIDQVIQADLEALK